jgi:hypothetical protein
MIRKTYLILAHKNPNQLKRLLDRLNDDLSFFYIHIDRKSDVEQFVNLIVGDNIKFITNRINCLWGDFSQVIATINLMEEVVKTKRDGIVILLTGQDYPIKNLSEIDRFIGENSEYNFIDAVPVEKIWESYKDKIESYKFNVSAARGHCVTYRKVSKASLRSFLHREISLGQLFLLLKKRKLKLGLRQYGGSAWWAFNYETLVKMHSFINDNYKKLYDYYKYTTCPDEIFFQTIAQYLSEQDESIKIAPSLTYVNWLRNPTSASPLTFTIDDLEELKSQPSASLFARKFDITLDENILDALDLNNDSTQ